MRRKRKGQGVWTREERGKEEGREQGARGEECLTARNTPDREILPLLSQLEASGPATGLVIYKKGKRAGVGAGRVECRGERLRKLVFHYQKGPGTKCLRKRTGLSQDLVPQSRKNIRMMTYWERK